MEMYTYSDARQNLAKVLDRAKETGQVLIRRRDGSVFALTPQETRKSPLDVEGLNSQMSSEELLEILRESRSPRSFQ